VTLPAATAKETDSDEGERFSSTRATQPKDKPYRVDPNPMIKTIRNRALHALALTLAFTGSALLVGEARSGEWGKVILNDKAPIESTWSLCDVFDYAVLYENKSFQPLQRFALTGRLQADAAFFESNLGDHDTLEWRRFRYGFKSQHFDHFTLHAEADIDLVNSAPLYNKLTDAYVGWSRSKEFEIKLGKQGAAFTMDGATSSKSLLRMERSVLSTNLWFPEEYFTGVTVSGKVDRWIYNVGLFSSDGGPEFGNFEAGYFGLFSIGYDFADHFGLDKALVRADYVHSDISGRGNLNTRSLTDIGSLNATFEQGRWGLRTDFTAGAGYGNQSDLLGVAIMPYYSLSEEWQLAASYNYVSSDGAPGVRLDRYESRIASTRFDEAHEFYFGVNRYFCGHKLKWQSGVEYTSASDRGAGYDGWGVSSGIRISW